MSEAKHLAVPFSGSLNIAHRSGNLTNATDSDRLIHLMSPTRDAAVEANAFPVVKR